MNNARRAFVFQHWISTALVALAAIWMIRTAIAVHDLQTAYEAQGGTRFYYPTIEIAAGAAMLAIGAIAAWTRAWPLAPPLAVTVALFTTAFWVGYTA